MSVWKLETGAEVQKVEDSTRALAIDIDPRQKRVRLDLQITSGGPQELWQGAVLRRFFSCSQARWSEAIAWLESPPGQHLLATISQGYTAEMLWTGDWVAEWSEEAAHATNTIHQEIAKLVEDQEE